MPGRSFVGANGYRYGFNGKEKDDEIKGSGNSVDFGDRIYDPRIGRWTSVDKAFKLQPGQSPYKAFLNNPIIYKDPDGKTEFETITYLNEQTGKSVSMTRVVSTDVFKSGNRSYYDGMGQLVNESVWSDKVHHITYTIDKKGSISVKRTDEFGSERTTTSGPFKNSQTAANIYTNSSDWDKAFEGDGETQNGGFVFTSEEGGASPTKTKTLSDSETIDIGDLLNAFGAHSKGREVPKIKEALGVAETLNGEKEMQGEAGKLGSGSKTALKSDSIHCRDCQKMVPNDKDTPTNHPSTQRKK